MCSLDDERPRGMVMMMAPKRSSRHEKGHKVGNARRSLHSKGWESPSEGLSIAFIATKQSNENLYAP